MASTTTAAQKSTEVRFAKTKMCMYYNQGKCTKDTNCSFAHTSTEVQQNPVLYRTRFCISRYKGGRCKNGGNCNYAHSRQELRSKNPINVEPEEPVPEASPTASKRPSSRSMGTQTMPATTSPMPPTTDQPIITSPGHVNDNNKSPMYNNSGRVHMDNAIPQADAKKENPFHPAFPESLFQAPTTASLESTLDGSMSGSMSPTVRWESEEPEDCVSQYDLDEKLPQYTNQSFAAFGTSCEVIVKNTFLDIAPKVSGNASRRTSKSAPR